MTGAQEILLGEAEVCLCGGTESMSQAPHVVRGARWGQLRLGDAAGAFEDTLWAALTDPQCGLSMAQTAEKLAEEYGITREEADEVAYRSQQRAAQAWEEGRFDAEVVPVDPEVPQGRDAVRQRRAHAARDLARNARRPPPLLPQDGLVTAGNASGIGDGAAATLIASAEWAERNGVQADRPPRRLGTRRRRPVDHGDRPGAREPKQR